MILDRIVDHKKKELDRARRKLPTELLLERLAELPPRPPGGFRRAIDHRLGADGPAPVRVIAEVKKASPSRGVFRDDFDHLDQARAYARSRASAISVLTDEHFFQGSLDILGRISREVELPLLRKDFVIDEYQLLEARLAGASAALLIVAVLGDRTAALVRRATELGLDALVEVHDRGELELALEAGAVIIGVNNRNLKTFEVSLTTSLELAGHMPAEVTRVAESGITSHDDITKLAEVGFQAVLVGESLVLSDDPAGAIDTLLDGV